MKKGTGTGIVFVNIFKDYSKTLLTFSNLALPFYVKILGAGSDPYTKISGSEAPNNLQILRIQN
jgi:hypothetical protein